MPQHQELTPNLNAIDEGLLALDDAIPHASPTLWTKVARAKLDALTFEWEQLHSQLTGHTPPHPRSRTPRQYGSGHRVMLKLGKRTKQKD